MVTADQCTYDYKGIGVCVEGVDDGCMLAGASLLRGNTLTCGSSSCEWACSQGVQLMHARQLTYLQQFSLRLLASDCTASVIIRRGSNMMYAADTRPCTLSFLS